MKKQLDIKKSLPFWFKLGWISFGGPAGQIAIMHDYIVERYKWVSEKRFLHALNYCMILPGPEAQQLATYIGWLLHGRLGGLIAGALFVLPSMFILLTLSIVYVSFGQIPWVYSIFDGIKPAILAMVILATFKIAKKSFSDWIHIALSICAFIALFFFNVSFPYIILFSALCGTVIVYFQSKGIHLSEEKSTDEDDSAYLINKKTDLEHLKFNSKKFIILIVIMGILWLIPYLLLTGLQANGFWHEQILFFTKTAFITFGGAYAVLPYVAQVTVEQFSWLSKAQMIDGLALGESTPGPLIMVLTFVGFMAGYNMLGNDIFSASLALIITTYYTFLPCFFFIFGGGPFIEQSHDQPYLKKILSFITAAVVGVILNLGIYFGSEVLFHSHTISFLTVDVPNTLFFIIASLFMLKNNNRFLMIILLAVVFGLSRYFFAY